MPTPPTFDELLQQPSKTATQALDLFDRLELVDLEFMLGRWRGDEFPTQHPMDGALRFFNWYGKEFCDAETVHPLLFIDTNQNIFKVAPKPFLVSLALPYVAHLQHPIVKPLFWAVRPWLETQQSQARLRMMRVRDQVSATMIYDHLPIHDTFKKVDDQTVLGMMDMKGMTQPFFFVLRRV
ncbi:MAG: DUF4334 domain-containing protein [Spirulina sp. SIO3F2]|nr:DUF4334 domain-containing protein [Spirulina sp. SIO3F2]